jgi:hypothetical protein
MCNNILSSLGQDATLTFASLVKKNVSYWYHFVKDRHVRKAQDSKGRTARARLSEQNIQNRTPRKGHPQQDSWDRIDKTGQAEYDRRTRQKG